MDGEPTLPERYAQVLARITRAAGSGPAPRLLAVSKTKPASAVMALIALGHTEFGENYVQEGIDKIQWVRQQGYSAVWHLIGPLQSNKTRGVAQAFDWVQSVDRLKIAQRLSEQRPAELPPLQICIQVNSSAEASKSGVMPSEALELCQAVSQLPRLTLRGLMSIPSPDHESLPEQMAAMQHLYQQIKAALPSDQAARFDTLSLGMTQDLELAIAHGSTMVRVGTALFGAR
jgi:pyridoxal phosphate enzyme (YggS family)